MPNAITHRESLGYVAEATWGTTPASALQLLRYTTIASRQDKTTVESNEITTSREVADIIQTAQLGGLEFGVEMSYGFLDDIMDGLLGGAWTANVLKVGTTRKSYTIERQFNDITRFLTHKGAIPNKLDMNISIGNIITGSVGFISKTPVSAATTAGTGGPTAALTNTIMDPIASIQLIQEGGSGSVLGVTEVSMSLANGIISFDQLASVDPADIQLGEFTATGRLGCYFADATYLAKYLGHTQTSLIITVGGAANLKYAFFFPKIRLSTFDAPNQGKNNKIIQMFEWKAYKDATDTTVRITRTP